MATDASVPWDSPKLRGVLACTLVLPLGVALLSPVLPIIRDTFAVSDAQTSLLITLYFLPGIALSPVVGLLADRFGRRAVLIPSMAAFGLVGCAIALVDAFAVVLALRAVQGAAATGVFILTVTFISDSFDGLQRNVVLGVNSAVLFAGAAIFPFLGGLLGSIDWHVPFYGYLVAVPLAIYAFTRLDEPPNVPPRCGPGYLEGAAKALPPTEALALYGATFVLEAVAFGAILTVLPFVLATDLGAPPVVTGGVITSMMLVSAVVAWENGALARRRSNHRLLAVSFCCYAGGLLSAWAGSSIPVVVAGAGIVGVGFGLAHPSVDAAIGRLAPPEYRAGALSLRNSVTFTGRAAGPILFTGLATATGYQFLLLGSGVGTLLVGAVGLYVTDGEPRVLEDATAG